VLAHVAALFSRRAFNISSLSVGPTSDARVSRMTIVVDGASKEVGHLIPGALEHIKVTPELKARIARVAANCDAEIIHEH